MERWGQALAGRRLVVSGFGMAGGGLYDLTDGVAEPIDDLSTVGLALGGGRLWRLLRAPGEHTGVCELLSYDATGVHTYVRLDEVRDPHDVCIHDNAVHITSSWDNAVWRLGPSGYGTLVWQGSTVPDSWHPNSLISHGGSLHVCVFGRFDRHKDWRGERHRGSGFVLDLATGRDVLSGLDAPHDPRPVGDRWYVCESSVGTLSEFAADGTRLRRIPVGHYARGLEVAGDHAFVGVSAHRDTDDRRAEVVVVDLAAGAEVERITLPCFEVYEVLLVPAALVDGLRRGFATNPARVVEQAQRPQRADALQPTPTGRHVAMAAVEEAAGVAEAGVAQPLDALGGVVSASPPVTWEPGELRVVPVQVTNRCAFALTSVPPHPIGVASRWFRLAGDGTEAEVEVGPTAAVAARIDPGRSGTLDVVVNAPLQPGAYRLSLALQQAGVAWFGIRCDATVDVSIPGTPEAPDPSEAFDESSDVTTAHDDDANGGAVTPAGAAP